MFQSLFFWKWLADSKGRVLSTTFGWSFNPCFSGSGSQTSVFAQNGVVLDMFQSLFFWKWLADFNKPFHLTPPVSVSILVFLEVARRQRRGDKKRCSRRYVSILVFLEVARRPPTGAGKIVQKVGFQSLFFWKWLADKYAYHLKSLLSCPVSILVFLEVARRLTEVAEFQKELPRFNPCFSGSGSQTNTKETKKATMIFVSILVFLEVARRLVVKRLEV